MRKIPTVSDVLKITSPSTLTKVAAPPAVTIGMDLGDRRSHVCVLDRVGGVERFIVDSTAPAIETAFAPRRGAMVVIEAGGHSPWVSRLLVALGLEVIVANPNQLRAISESHRKTDRADAEMLARLGRADLGLLRPVEHRSAVKQAHLEMLKARDTVMRSRTMQVNHVRGALKAFGVRAPACDADTFAQKAADHVPEALRPAIQPLLAVITLLTKSIRRYDGEVARLCKKFYPETEQLRQVHGVGPLTSLGFVLVLGSAARFKNSRLVGSYLGLCPKVTQSGERDPQHHISKAGNGFLRKLLVQSAHDITGPFGEDSTLRRVGLHLMASGGARGKKRAVVAVARRLAVTLLPSRTFCALLTRTRHAHPPVRSALDFPGGPPGGPWRDEVEAHPEESRPSARPSRPRDRRRHDRHSHRRAEVDRRRLDPAIHFSNSPIEAWWRILKHSWLFLHSMTTATQVRSLVEFYVAEHNAKLPRSAFDGQTPDEMFFGTGEHVPDASATARAVARQARLATNRELRCAVCA